MSRTIVWARHILRFASTVRLIDCIRERADNENSVILAACKACHADEQALYHMVCNSQHGGLKQL